MGSCTILSLLDCDPTSTPTYERFCELRNRVGGAPLPRQDTPVYPEAGFVSSNSRATLHKWTHFTECDRARVSL